MKASEIQEAMKTSYVESIDKLIPLAWKRAVGQVEKDGGERYRTEYGTDGKPYKHCYISEYFHQNMKEMAIDAGLRTV